MKTTLNLNDQILLRAKTAARQRGLTLTSFVEEALQTQLMTVKEPATKYKFAPPVVAGTRPPAVDVADREELHDFLDTE